MEYMSNEKWEPAQIIHEKINIYPDRAINYDVIYTKHGPVLSDILKTEEFISTGVKTPFHRLISFKGTFLTPSNFLEDFVSFNFAKDFDTFRKTAQRMVIVYFFFSNHIYFFF